MPWKKGSVHLSWIPSDEHSFATTIAVFVNSLNQTYSHIFCLFFVLYFKIPNFRVICKRMRLCHGHLMFHAGDCFFQYSAVFWWWTLELFISMHAFPIIIHILTTKKNVIISLRGVFTDLASPFLLLEITTVVANSRDMINRKCPILEGRCKHFIAGKTA